MKAQERSNWENNAILSNDANTQDDMIIDNWLIRYEIYIERPCLYRQGWEVVWVSNIVEQLTKWHK